MKNDNENSGSYRKKRGRTEAGPGSDADATVVEGTAPGGLIRAKLASSPTENDSRRNDVGGPLRVIEMEKRGARLRAAIYARVSGNHQVTIPEQVRIAMARARERGWDVRFILKDQAKKGDDFERAMFQRLFDLAERQAIDVVIVWRIDRLARSLAHAVVLEELMRENGAAVHSCTEPIDTTTPTGRFVFGILASAAQLEKEIIRERVKMGMGARAREGRWSHPIVPYGYRKTKGRKLRIHEVEANAVRAVFSTYERTRSCVETAKDLNDSGVPAKTGKWTEWSVRQTLENGLYAGRFRSGPNGSFQGKYVIIEAVRYDRIRAQMAQATRRGKPIGSDAKEAAMNSVFTQYLDSLRDLA